VLRTNRRTGTVDKTDNAKYQSSVRCDFCESQKKNIFRLPWQSQLSAEYNSFSDFVELHARNMLSFIQFGQVGKMKMFKQMFDARWKLSVTIAHVDSLGQVI